MSYRTRHTAPALLSLATAMLAATPALAGSWQNNAPFGATLQGDLYTPTTPGSPPAILVAIHYCTGNKSVVHSWFQSYADQHGFYIIAPDAGKQCFDSSATRGGDRAAIVKMVDYVVTNKSADKTRVFAAGLSSGGCMTNTLLAIYPDVFAGGAAMPGFTAGGWPAGDTTCTKCGSSPPSTDGKYWGDMARQAFSWSGTRPCVQQWVGGGDEYNFHGWLPAVAAQFQNLTSLDAGATGSGAPSGWTRKVYKDSSGNVGLETNLGPTSQKHDLSSANLWGQVITFLGLDKPTGSCGRTSSGAGGAASGGKANGGGTSTGGASTNGGVTSSSGGAATGGSKAAGGSSSANGGSSSPAGGSSNANGGASNPAGGATNSSSPNGGTSTGNGGSTTSSTSSSPSLGGSPSGNGGSSSSNATTGTGNTTATTDISNPPASDGCSCSVAGSDRSAGGLVGLILAGIGTLVRRRRRTAAQ